MPRLPTPHPGRPFVSAASFVASTSGLWPALRKRAGDTLAPRNRGDPSSGLRRWMHAALLDLPRDSAILGVGGDPALLALHLAEYSADVTVLHAGGGNVPDFARRFPEIAFLPHQPASPLPFARETFDAVWCCELLDRVIDPAGMLREVKRVLAPGGRLLASVPDHGPVRKALTAVFHWDERFARWQPQTRTFTGVSLAKLARDIGFGEIHTSAGGSAARALLMRARKGPGVQPAAFAVRNERAPAVQAEDAAALADPTRVA